MKRNGFTLVEVIAIVVVLAAIFAVSVPAISNVYDADEKKLYDNMVKDLCAAGKSYMYANMQLFPELSTIDSFIEIEIEDLISRGNYNEASTKIDELVNNKRNIEFSCLSVVSVFLPLETFIGQINIWSLISSIDISSFLVLDVHPL